MKTITTQPRTFKLFLRTTVRNGESQWEWYDERNQEWFIVSRETVTELTAALNSAVDNEAINQRRALYGTNRRSTQHDHPYTKLL